MALNCNVRMRGQKPAGTLCPPQFARELAAGRQAMSAISAGNGRSKAALDQCVPAFSDGAPRRASIERIREAGRLDRRRRHAVAGTSAVQSHVRRPQAVDPQAVHGFNGAGLRMVRVETGSTTGQEASTCWPPRRWHVRSESCQAKRSRSAFGPQVIHISVLSTPLNRCSLFHSGLGPNRSKQ